MNFIGHPNTTDDFDAETFVDDNTKELRKLVDIVRTNMADQIKDFGEKEDQWDEDEVVATLTAAAIVDEDYFPMNSIHLGDSDNDLVIELAQALYIVVILFRLEDEGLVEFSEDGKVCQTEKGRLVAEGIIDEKE